MTDETPNLALPYIAAGQAQKHVTHNEALRALDALVQMTVADRHLTAPPATTGDGVCYIVAAGATGAWAGHDGQVAARRDGAWSFLVPREGWLAWVADEDELHVFDGSVWRPRPVGLTSVNPIPLVGVNATADAVNRLSVKSGSVLFSHDDVTPGSGDTRLTLNKKLASNTATLLFQDGWSGRAEFGLAGDDKLHVKVSANGSSWIEALTIDPATGNVGVATVTPSVRLDLGQATFRAGSGVFDRPVGNSSEFYYQRGGINRWNFGMAGTAESGSNAGSNFYINRYGDDGSYLGTPFNIVRSSGETDLFGSVTRVGALNPAVDNTYTLGASGMRWASVWAANGTIQTSDARDKTDVEAIADAVATGLVDAVAPITFRWIEGGRIEVDRQGAEAERPGEPITEARPGTRRHAGFLAQEVRAAMSGLGVDFAAWGLEDKDDADSRQWLRPDQLIPVLWAALRETRGEIAALRDRVALLEAATRPA